MSMYNIIVNDEVISENVLKSDVSHKLKIIKEYYKYNVTSQDLENPIIKVVLNNSETIV